MQDNVQPTPPAASDEDRRPDPLESALLAAWNAGEPEETDAPEADAQPDADLMRVDAPQVSGPRTHTVRLLDAPGATMTVTCPDWCISDHQDEMTRGTFAADFTHQGAELVLPSPAAGDAPLISARITHAPFSHALREPVMGVWPADEEMGAEQVSVLADRLRAFADELDSLSVDLDDARLTARNARGGTQ
ncbi:hypothetical protein ABZ281_19035 [Streptomyces sp. NPDC006265]|uniref:DUF6907 domain-containing protein n=1 Tax=Streptomyces sp. NPDC006265 TaxID=3156740 RepID=UPI0033AC22F9